MFGRIRRMIRSLRSPGTAPTAAGNPPPPGIQDQYAMSAPGPQNALDIFKGQWSTRLPGEWAELRAGELPLGEDPRVEWLVEQVGGVRDRTVLELGPLEGAHTYMLERLGATSVLAVEANPRAYLKCLITKEILGLQRSRFICGDFVEHLRRGKERYDVCLACGVLYHMIRPAELIALMARATDRVCIWTQYFDPDLGPESSVAQLNVVGSEAAEEGGFQHTLYRSDYSPDALAWGGFCGGATPSRHLMSRKEILACLEHFGLTEISIGHDDPNHPLGPAFAVAASRGGRPPEDG